MRWLVWPTCISPGALEHILIISSSPYRSSVVISWVVSVAFVWVMVIIHIIIWKTVFKYDEICFHILMEQVLKLELSVQNKMCIWFILFPEPVPTMTIMGVDYLHMRSESIRSSSLTIYTFSSRSTLHHLKICRTKTCIISIFPSLFMLTSQLF